MKIFAKKKEYEIIPFIVPVLFFIFAVMMFLVFHDTPTNLAPLLSVVILFIYAKVFKKVGNLPSYIDLLLLLGIVIVVFFFISFIPSRIIGFVGFMPNTVKVFVFGISTIGFVMLITLLFDSLELSLLFSIFIAQLVTAIEGASLNIGTSLFCVSLASAMLSYRLRGRSQVVKAVFFSVLVFFFAYLLESMDGLLMMAPINLEFLQFTLLAGVIASLMMMIALPVIVTGLLYLFEYIFKVVTNISLLELSDFNHPILRRLILEAPGTYQHSLVVANLSEAASEAIGTNSLLARVGAYYHDIGKLVKPDYFVENQILHRDAHKTLKPSMSKLIILNHVKEGVELAKKKHLNPRIIDFITQHHGRTLIYYFYKMAKELEPDGEHEEEYRYPGPKPQTKEIAIVSLADTIEAVSRTLEDPTPARIEELVREVVRKRFMEGELDETNLTLKEVEYITQSFIRVLNAVFHTRINYPKDEPRKNNEKRNG
ncbi:MAG: HDIG domain-containing protein [Candidatus Omnitrophica bacterium]|nr:HDIG domain-containing protein [Candidatus Omnitrophota bacterium]